MSPPGRADRDRANEPPAKGERPIRVLIAKPGLDGHDRGVKIILRTLWEAGMETIYTGMRVTPRAVALAAAQEDVDAIGISNHSGAHLTISREVIAELEAFGVDRRETLLFCGGAIPPDDVATLRELGFDAVFPPGSRLAEIVEFLERAVAEKRGGQGASDRREAQEEK